jgi:mRNA interferase MazF
MSPLNASYIPDRGDIVWLDFNPQSGHEQAGRRPALVLSLALFNRISGFALMCPITNTKRGNTFEIELPAGFMVTGVILTHQIKSLDWRSRNIAFYCQCPQNELNEALARVRTILK